MASLSRPRDERCSVCNRRMPYCTQFKSAKRPIESRPQRSPFLLESLHRYMTFSDTPLGYKIYTCHWDDWFGQNLNTKTAFIFNYFIGKYVSADFYSNISLVYMTVWFSTLTNKTRYQMPSKQDKTCPTRWVFYLLNIYTKNHVWPLKSITNMSCIKKIWY